VIGRCCESKVRWEQDGANVACIHVKNNVASCCVFVSTQVSITIGIS
jgi:hypothetical protein